MDNKKHTEESKQKMREIALARWKDPEYIEKQKLKNKNMPKGKDVHNWTGDYPEYRTLHRWVIGRLGKAWMCESCGKDDKYSRYEWSNIDGNYKRDLNDFIMLCVSCHRKRDNSLQIRKKKDRRINLEAAKLYATLSYAKRLKVGAVLLRDGHIVSNGRNGTPSGFNNDCELDNVTVPEVIHAECNVILFAAKNGISTDGTTLVITHSPCFECSKMIIQSGIKEVYYETEYRDTSSVGFLRSANITCERINSNGDIIS